MRIYNKRINSINYRKIYKDYHGSIPTDSNGRSYDIHHVDGNPLNNDIENLIALSIQDHYDLHFSQQAYGACRLIAMRMELSREELSNVNRLHSLKRVQDGTHPFLGGAIQSESNQKRIKDGTHHLLGPTHNQKRVEDGTHPFLGGSVQRATNKKRVEEGNHNFLDKQAAKIRAQQRVNSNNHNFQGPTAPSQWLWTCEYCGKSGKGRGPFTRYHKYACIPKDDL